MYNERVIMKLFYTPTSPYARKVRVMIYELELDEEIDTEIVFPLEPDCALTASNPLGKVPTLALIDGSTLFDSRVICAYLDTLGDTSTLLPRIGTSRWQVERAQSLGDGVMDAAYNMVMETKRPDADPSEFWMKRWEHAIRRALAEIAADIDTSSTEFHLGHLTYACALGYLDFRLPQLAWQTHHPELANWWKKTSARPSFIKTQPL